ncbi:ABC transporter permease [Nocardia concava]|uniref:ABC transporter permease n=1 Tax=Nocardia concava TaxID=257281 RepID=UPI00031A10B0|nr:ABC transporter permease [Nocardia concava]
MPVLTEPARRGLLLRVLPPGLYSGRSGVIVERSLLVNRHSWVMLASGVVEPLAYLLAFQLGFGTLVTQVTGPGGHPMGYAAFVAPALLAAAAMNGAVFECTYNVFLKLRYTKAYDAMLATPIGPADIVLGEIGWAILRSGLYSIAFLAVTALLGLFTSWWALALLPAALLVAFAFAGLSMTLVTFLRSTAQFDYINLALVPMFLFSTTFFPLTVYPQPLQWLIRCLPLYQGIDLMRGLATGTLTPTMLINLAYLLALGGLGVHGAIRRLATLLRS